MDIVTKSRYDQKPARGPVKTKEEDFRMRRRKLYRLMTEEKPIFPMQQKNFYNHVMENKEVVKTLSLLSTCTQEMKLVSKGQCLIFSYFGYEFLLIIKIYGYQIV